MKRLFFISLLIWFTSCEFDPTFEFRVDDRLKPYVDNFYYEASIRGVSLRTENLTVTVSDLDNEFGVTYKDHRVVIDESLILVYPEYSEEVEVIVFHELGHALLHRGHTNKNTSIMQDNPCITCYKGDSETRSGFLHELFTMHTK